MINLLPPSLKEDLHYARRNNLLVRWLTTGTVCLLIGIALAVGGYIYLNQTINSTTQQIALTNKSLQNQDLASVQKQIKGISNNLKLVVQVLSKEILFSELLTRLGSVTPQGSVLTNLAIVQTTGGIDITAQTTDYNVATQLQVNLADPKNQIFSKADIVSINCTTSNTGENTKYPCAINMRALFAKDNPFLFINQKGVK